MKNHSVLRRPIVRCLAGVLMVPGLLSAEVPAQAENPQPARSHVLFMGADLSVPRDKKYYRVEDVVGSEFKITIGKKEFFVPTRNRTTDLKVDHSLKLSGASVQLDELQSGPAYTPANDPVRKMIAASGAAGGAAAVQDLAYGRMINLSINMAMAGQSATASENSGSAGSTAAAFEDARRQYEEALRQASVVSDTMRSSQFDTSQYVNKMYNELSEGNYDAMEVSFKISSPVELDDPYMVILFKFLAREAKPGEEGMLIHAKSLEPVGPKPKYVRVREAGLPPGFKFIDCTVHIYNRGQEIATNASPKRVEITRAEAQQYLVIDHIGTNKGATIPAAAVPGTLPPSNRQKLSIEQLNRTCYAKIGDDGSLRGVYVDKNCQQPLEDPGTLTAIGEVFFKPALEKGKPVEGVARFSLGSI